MTWTGFLSQLLEIVLAIALAPLLTGWVNQWRAWLQNKSAPSLWQPYRLLHKLFNKESVVADNASRLFRTAPYVVFGCMVLACAIIPTLSTDLPLAPVADAIALVGLFALARVFISLAAMDVGTSFGTLGARREMLIGFLAEPALLMVLFSASLISKSTSLVTIVETLAHRDLAIYPGLAFAGIVLDVAIGGMPGLSRFVATVVVQVAGQSQDHAHVAPPTVRRSPCALAGHRLRPSGCFRRRSGQGGGLPRSVVFVEDLPRNASGKVLKTELRG